MEKIGYHSTIRRVTVYSVLVLALAFISPYLGGTPGELGLGFIVWGTAPMLVSLIMRAATKDWSDIGKSPRIMENLRWYTLSILINPLVLALTTLSGEVTGVSSFTGFEIGRFLSTTLTAFPIFLVFAVFEEVGWRGYMAPKLDSLGVNRYISSGITAVVWTAWHLPFIKELTWAYTNEPLVSFIPRYFVLMYAFSLIYGEIRTLTGSFWPAVLMHGVGNSVGHLLALEYVQPSPGLEYIGSVSTGLFMILYLGLIGYALNKWRLRYNDAG